MKRTFPRQYGVVDLLWTVRDCDDTDFGSQPGLVEQAKRLLFRAMAIRDLQTLLMTDIGAEVSLQHVQQAFYLMCWLIPFTEERSQLPPMLDSQLCSKSQGRPLKSFSDVKASSVWAAIPSLLRASVGPAFPENATLVTWAVYSIQTCCADTQVDGCKVYSSSGRK